MRPGKTALITRTKNCKMFLVKRFKPGAQGLNVFLASYIPTYSRRKNSNAGQSRSSRH